LKYVFLTATLLFCLGSLGAAATTEAGANKVASTRNLKASRPFDFTAYCDPDEMRSVLKSLFPRGTTREVVEQKLVKEGGAAIELDDRPRSNPNILHYMRDVNCNPENSYWGVNVLYDKHGAVWQISFTGGSDIFPGAPPNDKSDAGIFRLEDYGDADDLLLTLRTLFPKGTPRADVELVLLNWNLSRRLIDPSEPLMVFYRHAYDAPIVKAGKRGSEERVWNVRVDYFKDDDTVSQIVLDGSAVKRAFTGDEAREYFIHFKKKQKTFGDKH